MRRFSTWVPSRNTLELILEFSAVYAVIWLYQYGVQFIRPYMPGTDGYYHIKMAWLIRTQGLLDSFPWAAFSMWRDHFYDKELLFHILLIPFTFSDLVAGAKAAAVTYGAVIFTSFYIILRLNRIPWAGLWTFILLSGGGFFLWRTNVPRPQLLSISLSLWGIFTICRGKWLWVGIIGVLYALSYTAPHMLVFYSGVYLVCHRIVSKNGWDWKVVAAAAGGMLMGALIHPHFPGNFRVWWMQTFDLVSRAWGLAESPELFLGGEINPADTRAFLQAHLPVYVLAIFAPFALRKRLEPLGHRLWTLIVLSHVSFIMACFSKRFVEYFVPFSVWLFAEIIGPWAFKTFKELRNARPRVAELVFILVSGLFIGLFVRSHVVNVRNFRGPSPSGYREAALWLKKHTPKNAQVFTCDWDDAPDLFFYNHHNRYIVFLDPNYLYRWQPETWQTWHNVSNGRMANPVKVIEEDFNSSYGYCTNNFNDLRRQLRRNPRVRFRLTTSHGYLFEIQSKNDL